MRRSSHARHAPAMQEAMQCGDRLDYLQQGCQQAAARPSAAGGAGYQPRAMPRLGMHMLTLDLPAQSLRARGPQPRATGPLAIPPSATFRHPASATMQVPGGRVWLDACFLEAQLTTWCLTLLSFDGVLHALGRSSRRMPLLQKQRADRPTSCSLLRAVPLTSCGQP